MINPCSAIMPLTKSAILTILTLSHRLRPSSQCSENSAMLADLLLRPQLANFAIDMHTITRNAIAMTVRMAVTTAVGLLTWRIALQLLGAYSLGLYSVIAGVIALGEVLYAALGGAYDRYMSYALGRGSNFGDIVAGARRLQARAAVAVVVLADTAGLWYVLTLDDVSAAGTWVAVVVFQLALATSVLTILAAPARSALTALERMDVVARVDITATIGRFALLAVLLWLTMYGDIDTGSPYPLVAYAVVCVAMPLWTCMALWRHTRRRIGRTGTASASMLRALLQYAAADFYGNAAVAIRDQGILLVFNAVGGLAATAALTLALAVVAKVQTWAQSILTAFVPPVIKAYAAGDNARMWRTAMRALAWSVGTFGACAAVLYAFADTLMPLWLGPKMPPMTVSLLGIALAAGLCVALTNVFASVVHATGRIRAYSLVSGTIYLCAPAVLYFAAQHYSADTAYAAIVPVYAAVTVCAILFARGTARHREVSSDVVNDASALRPRRILVIIRSLDIGGAEKALIDSLRRHTARPSQRIDILALCGGRWIDRLPENITVLPPVWPAGERSRTLALQLWLTRHGFSQPLRRRLARASIGQKPYDIVICWLEGLAAVAHDTLWPRIDIPGHTRHYTMIHSDFAHLDDHAAPWTKDGGSNERRYYYRNNAIIAVAPHVAASLQGFLGSRAPRIYMRPNSVDAARLRTLAAEAASSVPPRRPGVRRYVAVGRLESVKQFERLVDFARAESRNGPLEIRLIGAGSRQRELARTYAEARLSDVITMVGALDNPYGEIAAADAMVVTSASEGDSVAVREARALGCPVILWPKN